uniref:Uncharacterized protein n=1 Tax=Timema bartmani TaxID=61472 RepID=A0A7R9I5D8_9NEOP|nr:unnamed protein product [Timema bartmani]
MVSPKYCSSAPPELSAPNFCSLTEPECRYLGVPLDSLGPRQPGTSFGLTSPLPESSKPVAPLPINYILPFLYNRDGNSHGSLYIPVVPEPDIVRYPDRPIRTRGAGSTACLEILVYQDCTFPLLNVHFHVLKALVVCCRHRLIGRVGVLSQILVGERLLSSDAPITLIYPCHAKFPENVQVLTNNQLSYIINVLVLTKNQLSCIINVLVLTKNQLYMYYQCSGAYQESDLIMSHQMVLMFNDKTRKARELLDCGTQLTTQLTDSLEIFCMNSSLGVPSSSMMRFSWWISTLSDKVWLTTYIECCTKEGRERSAMRVAPTSHKNACHATSISPNNMNITRIHTI